MNRSILIIICDFLLVTLVAFSNFDAEKAPPAERRIPAESKTIGGSQDLMGTLKSALEDEQQTREKLSQDLASTRENLRSQEQTLRTQEQALTEREQKIKQFQESLRKTEEQAKQLDKQRVELAQQVSTAQTNLQEMQVKLSTAATQSLLSQEKLAQLQNDLSKREQETQALQQKLASTEKAAQAATAEKQQLTAQLQVSEVEKRLTREQVVELRNAVVAEKKEKEKMQETTTVLATNVGILAQKSTELAQKSTELTQEIRENRPLAPNTIFSQFLTNRITARFEATRSGLLGRDVRKDKVSQCILFTDGTQTYTLLHVEDTPLTIWNPGTDWNRITAVLQHGKVAFSGVRLSFLAQDPRVVVVPIGEPQARQYGVRIYKAAADPFKFQDAVIIGANEGYYGECKFQIDSTTSNYVKVDRNLLKGLFGQFNPSRGDLVFNRSGDLMGIMVNSDYCALLNKVVPTRTIQLGMDVTSQQTGQTLSQLYDRIFQMPAKLQ